MPRRLYLGKLAPDTRPEDVSKLFEGGGYGKLVDCRVMNGFGFIEFENSKDAEDAVQNFNGKSFMGSNIVVEFAKESRPRREPYEDRGRVSRRPPGHGVTVSGISRDTSWQDLKDFGREAGSVSFADIDRDVPGQGILEYLSRDDADRAVKELDGKDLRGNSVRVIAAEPRDGPDNFRRDDDRRREHYRDDRDKYAPRRDRSRSPPRRSEYDRPRGSPPPRDRRPYDDKRGAYDDRRVPDRRDNGREDRRRDDRYDDRPRGDGGWAR